MIENNDRGITLNKQFAYTLLVGLGGICFWVGVTITTLSSKIDTLTEKENVRLVQIDALERRVALMERTESATAVVLANISANIQELKSTVDAINRRLEPTR